MENRAPTQTAMNAFINKQNFPPDSPWPALLHCLCSQQFNENLSHRQRAEIADLLAEALLAESFSERRLQEFFTQKEEILNSHYVAELQAALEETAGLFTQLKNISSRRVGDIVKLEKTTLNTVKSGKNPSLMVAELRKAFREVIKIMEKDRERLAELSNTDQLTGMANRRFFDGYLEQTITTAASRQEELLLLMIDIDDFKKFNDQYGHLVGDEVLKIAAKIIMDSVAESNRLRGKNSTCSRYGGEEFGIIMPESTEEECLELAESLRKRIAHYPIIIRNAQGDILQKDIHITVSAGFCALHPLWLQEENPASRFIGATDKALYTAKKRGRNMVCQCKPYLDHNKQITLAIL